MNFIEKQKKLKKTASNYLSQTSTSSSSNTFLTKQRSEAKNSTANLSSSTFASSTAATKSSRAPGTSSTTPECTAASSRLSARSAVNKFTQKGNLKKHLKTHMMPDVESRKRYKCEFWASSYTERYNYKVILPQRQLSNVFTDSHEEASCEAIKEKEKHRIRIIYQNCHDIICLFLKTN